MKRSRLWYLRVSLSAAGLIVSGLVIALWVRSYTYSEQITIPVVRLWITSFKGTVGIGGSRGLRIPYLLIALLACALAALPWVEWSRRFSLRALLIIATLIAVFLGMIL
jgi:hypothetical protein